MSPRGKELNEEMRAEALAKIDSAALQVFADYGYHGATMRQIAQRAGVSSGLLYHYFPSKEETFRHLVDSAVEESLEAMRRLMDAPGTAWQRIEIYAAMVVETLFERDTSLRFVIMLQAMTQGKAVPGLLDHVTEATEAYYDVFVPVIEEAQQSGEASPGDPRALAAAFFSLIQGLATIVFQNRGLEKGITPQMLSNVLRNR